MSKVWIAGIIHQAAILYPLAHTTKVGIVNFKIKTCWRVGRKTSTETEYITSHNNYIHHFTVVFDRLYNYPGIQYKIQVAEESLVISKLVRIKRFVFTNEEVVSYDVLFCIPVKRTGNPRHIIY